MISEVGFVSWEYSSIRIVLSSWLRSSEAEISCCSKPTQFCVYLKDTDPQSTTGLWRIAHLSRLEYDAVHVNTPAKNQWEISALIPVLQIQQLICWYIWGFQGGIQLLLRNNNGNMISNSLWMTAPFYLKCVSQHLQFIWVALSGLSELIELTGLTGLTGLTHRKVKHLKPDVSCFFTFDLSLCCEPLLLFRDPCLPHFEMVYKASNSRDLCSFYEHTAWAFL